MTPNEIMVAVMVIGVCGSLMLGFPVAFTLAGASMVFGLVGTISISSRLRSLGYCRTGFSE